MSAPTIKPLPRRHPNTKRTGELAEAAFVVKATKLSLPVAKPWGDSERYDFILDAGHCTWRVQIKCTESINAGGYQVQSTFTDGKQKGHYTDDDIDVLVAYILPRDLWYVIPAHALPSSASLRFYPDGNTRNPRFEQYREAWDLFLQPKPPRDRRKSRASTPPSTAPATENMPDTPDLSSDAGPSCDDALSSDAPSSNAAASSPDQDPPNRADSRKTSSSALESLMTNWSARVNKLYKKR